MRRRCTYDAGTALKEGWLIGFGAGYFEFPAFDGITWRPEIRAIIEEEDGAIVDWPISLVTLVDQNQETHALEA